MTQLADELTAGGTETAAATVDITDQASIAQLGETAPDATRVALVAGVFKANPRWTCQRTSST